MFLRENREFILMDKAPLFLQFGERDSLFVGQARASKGSEVAKEGLGTFVEGDRELYCGIFKNNQRSHLGFLKNVENSYIYFGEFQKDSISGYG